MSTFLETLEPQLVKTEATASFLLKEEHKVLKDKVALQMMLQQFDLLQQVLPALATLHTEFGPKLRALKLRMTHETSIRYSIAVDFLANLPNPESVLSVSVPFDQTDEEYEIPGIKNLRSSYKKIYHKWIVMQNDG